MKKLLLIMLTVLCLGLTGCLAPTQTMLTTTYSFDRDTAEKQMRPGNNTIKGSALLRQRGGGIVTCAGGQVALYPYSRYAQERMQVLYLDENGGNNPFVLTNPMMGKYSQVSFMRGISTPAEDDYIELRRETQCNAQGFFSFSNLADGDYYIVTVIEWVAPNANQAPQGGYIMKKVHVEGGETKEVVINGQP